MELDVQSLETMLSQHQDIKITLSPVFLFEIGNFVEKFSQTLKNDYKIDYSHVLEFHKIQANLIERYFKERKVNKEYEQTLTAILESYKNILDKKETL